MFNSNNSKFSTTLKRFKQAYSLLNNKLNLNYYILEMHQLRSDLMTTSDRVITTSTMVRHAKRNEKPAPLPQDLLFTRLIKRVKRKERNLPLKRKERLLKL